MTIQDLMAIGGGIVLFANVVNVIYKWLSPAFKIKKEVEKNKELIARLQAHDSKDYEMFAEMREVSKAQCRGLVSILNHMIDGNGVDKMQKTRNEIIELMEKI